MESVSLQAIAKELKEKKAQVEASVPKLQMDVKFNPTGFYNYLLQRLDILVDREASEGSALNSGSSFQEDILEAMSFYQIPLINEINEAFNVQSVFPFAGVFSLSFPPPINWAFLAESSLRVIGDKLLEKKSQLGTSLGGLPKEVAINLRGFYKYLTQRMRILDVAGGSIPNPVSYLQGELAKACTFYQIKLGRAVNNAFTLQTEFPIENRENTQQQASGADDLLDDDDDLQQDFFNDDEHLMHDVAEVETNNSEGDSQVPAEHSVPVEERPNQRSSVSIKSESRDDSRLAVDSTQPPAGHVVDSGNISEESDDKEGIVEEVSAQFQEQEVILITSDEEAEGSFVDDNGNDSDEDAEVNMSDIENHQNDSEKENSIVEDDEEDDDEERDDSRGDPNYEEDGEEVEVQATLGVAGPSSMTLRRSTRHSARVTNASSGQDQQDSRRVAKRQTVAGRSSNGPRIERHEETELPHIVAKNLQCTVAGCEKKFPDKDALNDHYLSAHKLKKYRCLVRRCYGKEFTSFATKNQFTDHFDRIHASHLRQVHGRTRKLACHCSTKFKNYHELCTHYWQYHELGHFACSKDGCTFKPTSTRIKVQGHVRIHREAKFECPAEDCDKSFKRKDNLNTHLLTHTGERSFPCPECDKSFSQKGTLTTHLRIHLNDKCYKCTWPQCTHSSTNRSSVLRHIRMVHFKLPRSKKQQAGENIEDDRDPRDYLVKD